MMLWKKMTENMKFNIGGKTIADNRDALAEEEQ